MLEFDGLLSLAFIQRHMINKYTSSVMLALPSNLNIDQCSS